MSKKTDISRPFTATDIYRKKMNVLNFDGEFLRAFGKPEVRGSWIFIGEAFQGKTAMLIQLAKYLTQFGKVLVNSIEEGVSFSVKRTMKRERIEDISTKKFHFLDREPIPIMLERLDYVREKYRFVFIDSVQYSFIDKPYYHSMLVKYPNTQFIWISHAKGKEPIGSLAQSIWFDAFIKARIQGHRCFVESRYNGIGTFDIWPEMAQKYWAGEKVGGEQ